MYTESNLKERCQKILEENGGNVAARANRILLEEPMLKNLQAPLDFISENWRDPLTPSLMALSCEAVGGQPEITHEPALALSLMNLSFYIWDDIIDKAPFKQFKPTLFGKFGEGAALIIAGLASAKAFSILNRLDLDKRKRQSITNMIWTLWTKMAKAETVNLRLRSRGDISSKKKLWVIKTEAVDLEECLRIGAVLGNGSKEQIEHLGQYGLCLGVILELWKDFQVSINLTLELAEKIKSYALPYSLLLAREHSEKIRENLENLAKKHTVEPTDVKRIVEQTLETKVLTNIMKTIDKHAKRAKEELAQLKTKNRATQALEFLVHAQLQLFKDSLKTMTLQQS